MPRLLADTTPLSTPEFRRMWWGYGLSNFGSQLTVVAVGLQVYALSGATLAVGVLGVCALVPTVLLGLYGGSLVDAHDRRTVALWSSVALWVCSVLLAAQAFAGVDSVLLLYGLVAAQSGAVAVNSAARSAIVPRLLPAAQLPAANALQSIAWNLAFTLGPLAGAALVAASGYAAAYAADAVTFTAAMWALLRLPSLPPEPGAAGPTRAGLASVLEGLRYLATRPILRMTFLVDIAAMVLAQPRVLFPAAGAVILGGGETTTGVLTAAVAFGALAAAGLSGPLTRITAQGRVVAWSVTTWGLSIAAFGLMLVLGGHRGERGVLVGLLAASVIALAVAGAADSVSAVFRSTMLQAATPDELRGRLQGVFIVVVTGGPRLGELVGGGSSSAVGEGWTAVLGGLACVAAVVGLMLWQPRFLAYDARHPRA